MEVLWTEARPLSAASRPFIHCLRNVFTTSLEKCVYWLSWSCSCFSCTNTFVKARVLCVYFYTVPTPTHHWCSDKWKANSHIYLNFFFLFKFFFCFFLFLVAKPITRPVCKEGIQGCISLLLILYFCLYKNFWHSIRLRCFRKGKAPRPPPLLPPIIKP